MRYIFRILNKPLLLVFAFCCFGFQFAEACNMPKPEIKGDDTVCENSIAFYQISPSLDPYKFKTKISISGSKAHVISSYYDYAIINFKLPGFAYIKFVYTDEFGCTDSVTKQIYIKPSLFEFSAGPDLTICQGDSFTIGQAPISGFTYYWNYSLQFVDNHPYFAGSISKASKFKYSTKSNYGFWFRVIATDTITGCSYIDTIFVKVNPRYKTNITGATGCINDTTVYSYATDSMPYNAIWVIEGGKILSSNNAKSILVEWYKGGTNTVKFKYNFNGCTDSAIYTVELDSLTRFPISGADTIFENSTHTYSTKNIKNTKNNWKVSGGTIASETDSTITVLWGNTSSKAFISNYKQNNAGCKSDTTFLPITIKKRDNLDLSHAFYIYPNPFTNIIKIASVNDFDGEIKIVLSDMPGRVISASTTYIHNGKNALVWDFDAYNLKPGLYNINIISKQENANWKVVKEQ